MEVNAVASWEPTSNTHKFVAMGTYPSGEKDLAMKAIWQGVTIAESDDTFVIEGNHYFPEASVHRQYTTFSNHRTGCAWKGQAHYLSLFVNGELGADLAWFYPEPTEAAQDIKGRIAFGRGILIVEG